MIDRLMGRRFGTAMASFIVTGLCAVSAAWAQQLPKPMQESEIRAAGGVQIRGPELNQMVVGNTMYSVFLKGMGQGKAGDVIVIYYRDGKTRVVRWPNRFTYQSNVWLQGDTQCVEQRGGTGAGHQCYSFWNLGSVTYACAVPQGDCLYSVRVMPGNPEGL